LLLTVKCAAALAAATPSSGHARQPRPEQPRRTLPAPWSEDVTGVFFDDARKALVGERPQPKDPQAGELGSENASSPSQSAQPLAVVWTRIISSATIENEIKALKLLVDDEVKTPGKFRGGGYRRCHDHFSLLAAMFALVAQYDEEVRWKQDAAGMRLALAHTATRCKVGSDQAYREAQLRMQQLDSLVRGQQLRISTPDRDRPWSEIAARPPLMRRLERAHQQRLGPWLSSAKVFRQNLEKVAQEAQVLAALAQMIQFEDYEFWDDEGYLEPARQLQRAGIDMVRAAREGDYDGALSASAAAGKACSQCHDGYRIAPIPP
jgi:hypothetical protein